MGQRLGCSLYSPGDVRDMAVMDWLNINQKRGAARQMMEEFYNLINFGSHIW